MKKKIIAVLFFILVIIAAAVAVLFKMNAKKEETKYESAIGNTAGNLYNNGYFCETNDGYVYFSNAYDNNALYIMKSDETEIKKLIPTETEHISAVGKYFYYYQSGSGDGKGLGYIFNTNGIYRADAKTGLNSNCINMNSTNEIVFANNYIYYTSIDGGTDSTNRMSLDGKKKEKIFNFKASFSNAGNGKIYFTDGVKDMYLKQLSVSSNSVSVVLPEDVYMPIVEGNYVYFIDIHNNYSLAVYDMLSMTKTTLDNERTDILNISNNYIYYQTAGENPQLKRILKNGGGMEVVEDGAHSDINITSRYVYFRRFQAKLPMLKTSAEGPVFVTEFGEAKKAALSQ